MSVENAPSSVSNPTSVEKTRDLVKLLQDKKISKERFFKVIESDLFQESYPEIKLLMTYIATSHLSRDEFIDFMNNVDIEYIIENHDTLKRFADYYQENEEILTNFSNLFSNIYVFNNIPKIRDFIGFLESSAVDIQEARKYKTLLNDYFFYVHFVDLRIIIDLLSQLHFTDTEVQSLVQDGHIEQQFHALESLLDAIKQKDEEIRAAREYLDYLQQNLKIEESKLTQLLSDRNTLSQQLEGA